MDIDAIILALIAIIPGAWALINQRKKDKDDNSQKLIDQLQERIDDLNVLVKDMEARITDRDNRIDLMRLEFEGKIATLTAAISERDKKIEILEGELERVQRENVSLKKRVKELETIEFRSRGKTE